VLHDVQLQYAVSLLIGPMLYLLNLAYLISYSRLFSVITRCTAPEFWLSETLAQLAMITLTSLH